MLCLNSFYFFGEAEAELINYTEIKRRKMESGIYKLVYISTTLSSFEFVLITFGMSCS